MDVKRIRTICHFAMGMGHTLVLAQMFLPGFDQEALDEAAWLRDIVIQPPLKLSVAQPLRSQWRAWR